MAETSSLWHLAIVSMKPNLRQPRWHHQGYFSNILNLEPQKSLCGCFDGVSLWGLTWFWSSFCTIFSNVQNLKSDFKMNQRRCITSTDCCELFTCLGLVSDLAVSCFILVNTLMCHVSFPLPLFVFFFPPAIFTCFFLPASKLQKMPSVASHFKSSLHFFFSFSDQSFVVNQH